MKVQPNDKPLIRDVIEELVASGLPEVAPIDSAIEHYGFRDLTGARHRLAEVLGYDVKSVGSVGAYSGRYSATKVLDDWGNVHVDPDLLVFAARRFRFAQEDGDGELALQALYDFAANADVNFCLSIGDFRRLLNEYNELVSNLPGGGAVYDQEFWQSVSSLNESTPSIVISPTSELTESPSNSHHHDHHNVDNLIEKSFEELLTPNDIAWIFEYSSLGVSDQEHHLLLEECSTHFGVAFKDLVLIIEKYKSELRDRHIPSELEQNSSGSARNEACRSLKDLENISDIECLIEQGDNCNPVSDRATHVRGIKGDQVGYIDNAPKDLWREEIPRFVLNTLGGVSIEDVSVIYLASANPRLEGAMYTERLGVPAARIWPVERSQAIYESYISECCALGMTPRFGDLVEYLPRFLEESGPKIISIDSHEPLTDGVLGLLKKISVTAPTWLLVNVQGKRDPSETQLLMRYLDTEQKILQSARRTCETNGERERMLADFFSRQKRYDQYLISRRLR